jgi:hypothetical protein
MEKTVRVWSNLKIWLAMHDIDPTSWSNMRSVKHWWMYAVHKQGQTRKAMASIAMLVSWEICKERNARIFQNSFSTSAMIVQKMKEDATLWSLAGAKAISILLPRE